MASFGLSLWLNSCHLDGLLLFRILLAQLPLVCSWLIHQGSCSLWFLFFKSEIKIILFCNATLCLQAWYHKEKQSMLWLVTPGCCHSKDKDLQLWRGLVYVKMTNILLKDRICDNCGNSWTNVPSGLFSLGGLLNFYLDAIKKFIEMIT